MQTNTVRAAFAALSQPVTLADPPPDLLKAAADHAATLSRSAARIAHDAEPVDPERIIRLATSSSIPLPRTPDSSPMNNVRQSLQTPRATVYPPEIA